MSENIFVDLNVIIDVFFERAGFEAARGVIKLGEQSNLQLYVSAHMVTTFAYLLEDNKVPKAKILENITWLLDAFKVVATDDQLLRAAVKSRLTDYEDAVVERSALQAQASVIITRNVRDFRASAVQAQTPEQYLESVA